jgi:hypothetical protein
MEKFFKTASLVLAAAAFILWLQGRIFNGELFFFSFMTAALCLPLAFKFARQEGGLFILVLSFSVIFFLTSAVDYAGFAISKYGTIGGTITIIILVYFAIVVIGLMTVVSLSEKGNKIKPSVLRKRIFNLFNLLLFLLTMVMAILVYFFEYPWEIFLVTSSCFSMMAADISWN